MLSEDEEDDDEYNGDLVSSDIEQIQNLLEFKVKTPNWCYIRQLDCLLNVFYLFQHEEVQFLENELENQKQKYQELASFTKSLLTALRNNDLEKQQVIIADEISYPQKPIIYAVASNRTCVGAFRNSWPVYLNLQTRTGTLSRRGEPKETCPPTTLTSPQPVWTAARLRQH